jgi:hypothetical protein
MVTTVLHVTTTYEYDRTGMTMNASLVDTHTVIKERVNTPMSTVILCEIDDD